MTRLANSRVVIEILRPKCATEFVAQIGRLHIVVSWFRKTTR